VPHVERGIGRNAVGTVLSHALATFSRRARAKRLLEQIRSDVERCSTLFVSLTRGGTIAPDRLPTDSLRLVPDLHADGILDDDGNQCISQFLQLAEEANTWLAAPPQHGPPGVNDARRWACLLRGRSFCLDVDATGTSVRDRALAAISNARSGIERRRWIPW
jgi:hypothetical protein